MPRPSIWRNVITGSVVLAPVVRLSRMLAARQPVAARRVDASDPAFRLEDERLIRVVDASAPIRALTRAGQLVVAGWRDSFSGESISRWRRVDSGRRVRIVAIVLFVASITHIAATRFAAPEPLFAARAAWIVVLAALAAIAVEARGVAAAWSAWTARARRRAHEPS